MSLYAIKRIEKYCKEHYTCEAYQHVCRVAEYALDNMLTQELLTDFQQEFVYAVALLHDIVEDTDVTISDLKKECFSIDFTYSVADAVNRLTQKENETYIEYIQNLKKYWKNFEAQAAYLVKLADMKDHLMQKDTLTDKLKEKYWEALPYLL